MVSLQLRLEVIGIVSPFRFSYAAKQTGSTRQALLPEQGGRIMKSGSSTGRFGNYVPLCAAAALAVLFAAGLAMTSAPEAEVNVSLASGYQGQGEVAVDPHDSDVVMVTGWDAGASGPVAWSSVDGGTSFTSTTLPLTYVGHAFAEGSEPSVAVDRDGVWYAAYEVHDLSTLR